MRLTGAEIIVECLIRAKVPYMVGIPGHGSVNFIDPLKDRPGKMEVIQVRHEQSAVHLADGYYRVSGSPLAVFTSIGPGAINTLEGLATCFLDSTAVLVFTGGVHTYMLGRGVLQELERKHWGDFLSVARPLTKRCWQVNRVDQLPYLMHRAFNYMLTGRPGPVVIDVPMDIQGEAANVQLPDFKTRLPELPPQANIGAIKEAARSLWRARRPVLLAGGGVAASDAGGKVVALAEHLGAAILTTLMGKGAVREDHPLYAWHTGAIGTHCGNRLANEADWLLAIGVRFEDQTCSSYVPGRAFSIPPTRLIQVDIEPAQIGKNYPVEIALVGDAKAVLEALLEEVRALGPPRQWGESAYGKEIARLKAEWAQQMAASLESEALPVTIPRFYKELRACLKEDGIVTTSAGNPQVHLLQAFSFQRPRCNLTAGGFSTMGFGLPAALGAKLAAPKRPVVAVTGDGDFMMTMQELATAVQYGLGVVVVVLNNCGWQSIRDLQISTLGEERVLATEFRTRDGELYSPNFAEVARAFGARGERIHAPEEVGPALRAALAYGGPALVEVMVNQDVAHSRPRATGGWWDMPVPAYLQERRRAYLQVRKKERLG